MNNSYKNDHGKRVKCFLLACVLFTSIYLQSSVCSATKSKDAVELTQDTLKDVIMLVPETTFLVDLNGDGKKDKVLFKSTTDDDAFTADFKLYINGKLCLHKVQDNSFGFNVQLFDLDTTDNSLNLYIEAGTSSDGIVYSSFATYDGKAVVENQFNPDMVLKYFSIFRYSLIEAKGDKTIRFIADTPIYTEAIGCYYCNLDFQIKDNKITAVPTNSFEFGQYSKDYKYKPVKSFKAYDKAGSKTSVFTVSKGSIVTFDKLYITKSGKAYVRVINSKGKKGWINASLKDLFKECPAWG